MRITTLVLSLLTSIPAAEEQAAKHISAHVLRAHTRFLSSDALMGRGPSTIADTLTQSYIASQFERLALKEGSGASTYIQPFEIIGISGQSTPLSFRGKKTSLDLSLSNDFVAVSGKAQREIRLENAELVFVGYGIRAEEYQWDDYKGQPLKGKVVILLNNDPSSDPNLFGGAARQWYGRWDYKYEMAEKMGAMGAIIVHTQESAGYSWNVVRASWSGEKFYLPTQFNSHLDVKAWVTESSIEKVVQLSTFKWSELVSLAQRRDFKPVPLGVFMSASIENTIRSCQTANVLGIIPGRDPRLAQEWVIVTAHHDHLGMRPSQMKEDGIFNGAVDNATGVAGLLAIAEAMKALPVAPSRSILFAAVAAEEQGLLGSRFLVEHLPMLEGKVAANLNLDGLNVWGRTRDVQIVGFGKSTLDEDIVQLARWQGRTVKPDPRTDRGYFYRSDQFNFARRGIPSAYFGGGSDYVNSSSAEGARLRHQWEIERYHQPSDEMDSGWNWSGAVEDVQLYFLLATRVAEAKQMPQLRRGDEFEAVRRAAIHNAVRRSSGYMGH